MKAGLYITVFTEGELYSWLSSDIRLVCVLTESWPLYLGSYWSLASLSLSSGWRLAYMFPTRLLIIRGWMQMVLAPNDLFSWNNRYNKYSVTNIFTQHILLELCTWTHSVHARALKPRRGSLPWPPAIFSFCHVFPLPLSGLNWRSLSPLGGLGPSPSKMAPPFTGPAHTPLPGSGTLHSWICTKSWPLYHSFKWRLPLYLSSGWRLASRNLRTPRQRSWMDSFLK